MLYLRDSRSIFHHCGTATTGFYSSVCMKKIPVQFSQICWKPSFSRSMYRYVYTILSVYVTSKCHVESLYGIDYSIILIK